MAQIHNEGQDQQQHRRYFGVLFTLIASGIKHTKANFSNLYNIWQKSYLTYDSDMLFMGLPSSEVGKSLKNQFGNMDLTMLWPKGRGWWPVQKWRKSSVRLSSCHKSDRGSVRKSERGSLRNSERGSLRNSERGSLRNSERGSLRNSERSCARNSERGSWKSSRKSLNRKRLNKGVSLYKRMPLKAMSRAWGKFNSLDLPIWLRQPAYKLYIWMFDCKLEEAAIEDLKHYKNLGEFFRRSLKPNVRPIAHTASITSPSDGKVLHYGKVEGGHVEQVKGVTYSLQGFLGPPPGPTGENCGTQSDDAFQKCLKHNPDHTALYHCIIYLAPGDYHRFHSPVEWNVHFRRHFPGELFSVNPGVARWIQGLFNFNERAVYTGEWQHGFFSLAAVGATNVGSIKVYCDKDLMTNSHLHRNSPPGTTFDACFTDTNHNDAGINFKKGESFGEFNLGSTIVLIFEAPDTFQFNVEPGQKIKFGQSLGDFSTKNDFEKKTS